MKKGLLRGIFLIVLLLLAIVLGKVGGDAALQVPWLHWLGLSANFGFDPVSVDLSVLQCTVGLRLSVNVLQAILLLLGILLYTRVNIRD